MSMIVRDQQDAFAIIGPAADLAAKISRTEFVPTALRNRPEAVLACILSGREVGLGPMQSLAQIHVIEGKPSLSAQAARALIQANGHEIWPDPEPTTTRCTMHGRRRGEEQIYTVTWTQDDVRRAQLDGRPNHKKFPRQMLVARTTGDLGRLAFADVLAGMPYLTEELQDGLGDTMTEDGGIVEQPKTVKRRTRRTVQEADNEPPALPEAPLEPQQGPATSEPPANELLAGENGPGEQGMTLAQQIAMNCKEAGVDRAVLVKFLTGKERARDVTREEAAQVLEAAKAIARGEKELVEVDGYWRLQDVVDGPPDDAPMEPELLPMAGR